MTQSIELIRAIRGAPLTVLAVLLLNRERAIGAQEIVTATGYSAPTVTSALHTLQALNLAQNHARYKGWQPASHVRQLVLGETAPAAEDRGATVEVEAKNFCLPSGSSSSHDHDLDLDRRSDQQLLQPDEAKNVCLPEEWQELVRLLVERCGAPSAAARRAIVQAYQAEYFPAYVHYEILRWLAYCLSDHGKSINNVGAFVASRIAKDLPCPEWFHPSGDELGWEIQRAEARWQQEETGV